MTKQLNQTVYAYILENINSEVYEVETTTEQEKLQFLADTFLNEYCFADNLKRHGTYQNVFAEWLKGLPSAFTVDFENYTIIRIAKTWGSIPENATEKQEEKILSNWFNFIAAKTFQLFNKHNINVYQTKG